MHLFGPFGTARIGYRNARVTPYIHALVDDVPIFLRDYNSLKQFTDQGVEKNNADAKRIFYQKSKRDTARDVLLHEARQNTFQHCGRRKRSYEKTRMSTGRLRFWGHRKKE